MENELKITIEGQPITKKNSLRLITKPFPKILPSKKFCEYQTAAAQFMPTMAEPINEPVNFRAVFFMPTRRAVDLANLLESVQDILVHYGVLQDDNAKIIKSVDGSRVRLSKDNPRAEITISPFTELVDDDFA